MSKAIDELLKTVDAWSADLPEPFDFANSQVLSTLQRQRFYLTLQFYSRKITVARTSMYRWDCRNKKYGHPDIGQEREQMAAICMESAYNILSHLPDKPDVVRLMRIAPSCHILHMLMQSMIVLLIELDSPFRNGTEQTGTIFACIEKGMRFLLTMAVRNAAWRRAWQICRNLYSRLAPKTSHEFTGKLEIRSLGWTDE
jgi:hypothetical protein